MRRSSVFFSSFACLFLFIAAVLPMSAHADATVERGAYLASIMDCTGCHTPGALKGQPEMARYLGGADIGFGLPGGGAVFPPNLTSDPETGLGKWSVEQIVTAIRSGMRPDGRALIPVMPFPSYSALTDEDATALATFLKTLPPVKNKVPGPFVGGEKPTAVYMAPVMPK